MPPGAPGQATEPNLFQKAKSVRAGLISDGGIIQRAGATAEKALPLDPASCNTLADTGSEVCPFHWDK